MNPFSDRAEITAGLNLALFERAEIVASLYLEAELDGGKRSVERDGVW